jgi:hypothetical protein
MTEGGAGFPGPRGRGGAPNLTTKDPMYVPVTVRYEGRTWTQVGMRYKGNSSLMSAANGSSGKIPFRLDFDRYEDETPRFENQRFYGFQKLTFSSNVGDDAQLREALAVEVLRESRCAGSARCLLSDLGRYRVGPEYWGLYTLIEDPLTEPCSTRSSAAAPATCTSLRDPVQTGRRRSIVRAS